MTQGKQRTSNGRETSPPHRATSYTGYLRLNRLLSAQTPLSGHHDELLFIIQHQTAELWMKLAIHELQATIRHLQNDAIDPCFKSLSRVRAVQRQLFEQWGVLETLTPSEYMQFRHVLGTASGLHSYQYRAIEFLLGNRDKRFLELFEQDPAAREELGLILAQPGLYDEFLRHLSRRGHAVPATCVERDWSEPYRRCAALVPVFLRIYKNPRRYWDAYAMCERLVDLEEQFQLWRFRHMKTVERVIGFKRGTGGSSGVEFLKQALDVRFFPELIDVRTEIAPTAAG